MVSYTPVSCSPTAQRSSRHPWPGSIISKSHYTALCSFEVAGVRHLSVPVWVYFPLSRHILISWSDCVCVWVYLPCLCVCVCFPACIYVGLRWLTGWCEDNMLRMTTERTLNSFFVPIMNQRENPCVCSLAIKTGWHRLPGTVSPRCPSLKDSAAPESFLSNKVVISGAVRGVRPWDEHLH